MAETGFREVLTALKQKTMFVVLLMGFASGLPYLLIFKTLQGWLTAEGLALKDIGFVSVIGLAYSCKIFWAPVMDRFSLGRFGRRKGWLLLTQVSLFIAVMVFANLKPAQNLQITYILGILIGFLGASQDIVVDAYRAEMVPEKELGLASAIYQLGYRIAMWITGGMAFILADHIGWKNTYQIMGLFFIIAIVNTLWAEEPKTSASAPKNMRDAIVQPLKEFFSRKSAFLVVFFILLYKVGDSFAGNMLTPFYLSIGFTNTEIGLVAKTMGMFSVIAGAFIGGSILVKFGIIRSLYVFGILQALSTASFALLYFAGHNIPAFAAVVLFEDFTAGMGSAAFMAFMASMTNKNYTATQYALLTSIMSFTARFIAAPSGLVAENLGWPIFFTMCALMAIPGLLIITVLRKSQTSAT